MSARGVAIAVAIAFVGVLLAGPGKARASYTVHECVPNGGSYGPAPNAFAGGGGSYSIWAHFECGNPNGMWLKGGPGWTANGAWLAWQINAAPGTRFAHATSLVHYGTFSGYGPMVTSNGSPGYTGMGGGNGPDQWSWAPQTNADWYAVLMQCFAAPNCHDERPYAYVTNFAAEVQDFSAPTVSAGGELLGGQVARGVQNLDVTVSDHGGGGRSISVSVNGVGSEARDFCPPGPSGYNNVKPCPDSSGVQSFAVDTQNDPGWANGPNTVRICAADAAGNAAPCVERTVTVDNSCPGSGGATAASELDSGVEIRSGELRDAASVTSNQAPVVRGSLRNAAGQPVSGATVCVYETVDLPDGSRRLAETATTQANGRFAARLEAGPSRDLDVVYRHNKQVLKDRLAVDSIVVPTLKIPTKSLVNGQAAQFRGAVPGPNAEGRVINLQARVGKKWRTFKVVKSGSLGIFRGKYPFRSTRGSVTYVFRAVVKRQGGYPYEPGSSRRRKVLVRG